MDFRNVISVQLSITHWKSRIIRGVTYSFLCFILVIIQRSTEKRRLHFRTLPTNQMRPTVTLTVVHPASEGEREQSLEKIVIDIFKMHQIKSLMICFHNEISSYSVEALNFLKYFY